MDYFVKSDSVGTISLFKRRKQIKLTHSGALTDHQHYEIFDYEPAMLNNFDDIRFVTQSGEHIPYWIETKTDGVSAKVWFKNDYVDGDTYIWMYYGSEGLSSGSSGTDVFIQFDDFEWGSDGDPITGSGGDITWTQKSGNVDISTTHSKSGTRSMKLISNNPRSICSFPQNTGEDYIIRCSIYKPDVTEFYLMHDDASTQIYAIFYGNDNLGWYDTDYRDSGYDGQENEWAVMEIRDIDWSANTYDIYWKDSLLDQIVKGATPMRAISQNNNEVVFNVDVNQDVWIDNVVIRKYTATEPTVTVGAEQHPKKGDMMIL